MSDRGELSDGYHTFNELYEHRHALFAALCQSHPELTWRSLQHHDGTMFDGMFIAGLETECGRVSYHLPMQWWTIFEFADTRFKAPEWDGQPSTADLARLVQWIQERRVNLWEDTR